MSKKTEKKRKEGITNSRVVRRSRRANGGAQYTTWDLATAARRISEGLSPDALNEIQIVLDLSRQELAHIVQISPRTIGRRKKEERLPSDESERVYRIARLVEVAASVLGSEHEARNWMKERNFALGEAIPLEVARTEPGAELVEQLLRQVEHGIVA